MYILKRLLLFIPTLLGVSLIVFFLNHNQPSDPVTKYCSIEGDMECDEKSRAAIRKRYHLDLPLFYGSLLTQAHPDTFYKIPKTSPHQIHKKVLDRFISKYGNWQNIQAYSNATYHFNKKVNRIQVDSSNQDLIKNLRPRMGDFFRTAKDDEIQNLLHYYQSLFQNAPKTSHGSLYADFEKIKTAYQNIKNHPQKRKTYLPALRWNGWKNQYHHWMTSYLQLDFGVSYHSGRAVIDEIKDGFSWTVLISVISIILAYLIAIPLGVLAAARKGKPLDKRISTTLFALYSLPNFWIAMLLIFFFANSDYWQIFPTSGLNSFNIQSGNYSSFRKFMDYVHHLILPIICWTYPALAFISRQMRGGMLSTLEQDYIRTARAKGLPNSKVVHLHAFRNALIPIITMLGNVLPRLIAGSVVLEVIFSIPGMGKLLFSSIQLGDFPVVFAIVMLLAILTMVGYLLADILYAVIDPRVKFKH